MDKEQLSKMFKCASELLEKIQSPDNPLDKLDGNQKVVTMGKEQFSKMFNLTTGMMDTIKSIEDTLDQLDGRSTKKSHRFRRFDDN